MFNLDQAIIEWRRQMIAGGIKTPVPLDELESHLREEIQNQLRSDATLDQAFALAVGKVGKADQLKAEFAKIEGIRKTRTRENLRRYSAVVGMAFVYIMLFGTWRLGVRSGRMEISVIDVVLAVGAMAPMILLGWAGCSLAKFLPAINKNWVVLLAIGALIFGAVLFQIIFPVLSLTNLEQVQIVSLWALSPMIGFGNCVSAWFDRCAELRRKTV